MAAATTITITDPALLAQLVQASGIVVFQDPAGRVLAAYTAAGAVRRAPPGVIPFTDEELAELSKQRTGRPIGDVLRDLKEKYGE
jgi:hypothetical protein